MKPREDIYFDPQRFPQSRAGKAQNFLQTKTARPQIIENTGLSEDIYFDPTRQKTTVFRQGIRWFYSFCT